MSDFLLRKSFRLFQDSKHIKKSKKSEKQRLKKKKNFLAAKQLEELEFQNNTLKNLIKLDHFSQESAVDISEKVLPKCGGDIDKDTNSEAEEGSTVFTEKDFEEFEKEYLDS